MISGTTRIYAIIGDPIGHVRTPIRFNEYFAAEGIDAVCVALHVPRDRAETCLAGLKAMPNLDGLVVTAPHKAAVLPFCDSLTAMARLAGAVNVVRRDAGGLFAGTLLDGYGFLAGLRTGGHDPAQKSVFIQGAGGAASAIGFALAEAGARALRFRNRSDLRAAELAHRISAAFPHCDATAGPPGDADIAVNATPVGLETDDPLPFDVAELKPGALVAEVLMQPAITRLLETARARGHAVHGGRPMLDHQVSLMFDFLKPGARMRNQEQAG
jgi:shikimate dehydrogenase